MKANSPVAVLSVSDVAYRQHVEGFLAKQTPVLSVEDSNIPELRRFIYNTPNEARKNEAKHQHSTILPGLFLHIDLFLNRTPTARKADLEVYVREPLGKYERCIDRVFADQEDNMTAQITSTIKAQEVVWLRIVQHLCDNTWDKETSGRHLTLTKHDGRRAARGKSAEVNMSAELVNILSARVQEHFRKAMAQTQQLHDDLLPDMEALCNSMTEQIGGDSNASFVRLGPPFLIMPAPRREDSYLVQAMLPIYAEIATYKGGSKGATTKIAKPKVGWPKYRKSYFKQVVCKPQGLWMEACDRAEADLIEALHREKQAVTASIGAVFQDYLSAFDTMCAAKANDDPAEMQLREHLKKNLQLAKAHWDKPMREAVDSLTKNFRLAFSQRSGAIGECGYGSRDGTTAIGG
ncbi:hypothetical protein Tdes44962_MAKER01255 [Teratosphaeria destructans]|uniref:Uncharacterized protein n=1 Tax=Teratosphaeria destructans TaxID=418781 RepID=A0A9W7T183_9PEZI|nr:hypothetical protein Tdes44962_MAKER01255 [Teratosphaeria destructans]